MSVSTLLSESLAWTTIPASQLECYTAGCFKVKIFEELFKKLKESLEMDSVAKSPIYAQVYAKHVFSTKLLSDSDNLATEEFLEWYVDTQNNDLMRRDYFLKVVVETKAKESDAYLVLKKCSNDDNILSYKAIKQHIDIPQNVIQLLKSTDLDAYKLYPMVVIRKKLEIGGVHVDLDQIYDEFGESYCVQSIKASTIEQVDSFLVNYNDFKPVYSKIFSILAACSDPHSDLLLFR
eukprot:NODE_311_length_11244_cov_0.423419.p4 type:complete len:235 gc:universal NODE_311_length_11244_cov_0.423419:3133-2429(-)